MVPERASHCVGCVMLLKAFRVVGVSALLAVALLGTVYAADMPLKDPPLPLPNCTWCGFYIGGNVGYSWGQWEASSNQGIFNFESATASPRLDGWLGGFQAGYNWQLANPWVIGLEGDIQGTGEKDPQSWTDPGVAAPGAPGCPPGEVGVPPGCFIPPAAFVPQRPGAGPAFLNSAWSFPWFGTVRGRVGFTPDAARQWMFYATGGLAFGEADYSFSWSNPGGAAGRQAYSLSSNQTLWGWVVGGGIEAVLSARWTAKLEYLYLDLGTQSINTLDIDRAPFSVNNSVRDQILRIGVNYHFDGPFMTKQ
jgi:outer membrane immunogenic protein